MQPFQVDEHFFVGGKQKHYVVWRRWILRADPRGSTCSSCLECGHLLKYILVSNISECCSQKSTLTTSLVANLMVQCSMYHIWCNELHSMYVRKHLWYTSNTWCLFLQNVVNPFSFVTLLRSRPNTFNI